MKYGLESSLFGVFVTILFANGLMLPVCNSILQPNGHCARYSDCFFQTKALLETSCTSLFSRENRCSNVCRQSLKRLLKKTPGLKKALRTCDCDNDFDCLTARARLFRCLQRVKIPSKESCTRQVERCENGKDENCGRLYERYFNDCTSLYYEDTCTNDCKKSYESLIQNQAGMRLKNCTCDGSFDQEKFCLHKRQLRNNLCKS